MGFRSPLKNRSQLKATSTDAEDTVTFRLKSFTTASAIVLSGPLITRLFSLPQSVRDINRDPDEANLSN